MVSHKLLLVSTLTLLDVILMTPNNAPEIIVDNGPELQKGYVTVYTSKRDAITKSGYKVREGICAGKEEWLGCEIAIYQRLPDDSVGQFLGVYDCLDTGGTEGLKTGKVIDIYRYEENVQDFIDLTYEDGCEGKIYIQVFKNKQF